MKDKSFNLEFVIFELPFEILLNKNTQNIKERRHASCGSMVINMEIYVVQQGDSIFSIAQKFGVSEQSILINNGIVFPDKLVPGQSILILIPEILYIVNQGDTLYSIAQKYGTTEISIIQNNPVLAGNSNISIGQVLVIKYTDENKVNKYTCGFAYPSIDLNILEMSLPYLTYVIIFEYGFNSDGSIIIPEDSEIRALALKYKTAVLLSLTTIDINGTFSTEKTKQLLDDKELQTTVLLNMLDVVKQKNAAGIDIDFEFVPPDMREQYVSFIELAANIMNDAGFIVNTDLAPKTSATQKGTLYEAHDYSAIGAVVNTVFLMTYEWGYTFSSPQAVAPINKVQLVVNYALTEIYPGKMYLGIPNYAYDWPLPYEKGVTMATTIGNVTAVERAQEFGVPIMFDETAQTPHYNYTAEDGVVHEVWFEDARSINAKLDLIVRENMLGAGYWNLMRPFPANWMLLNYYFNIAKLI